MTIIDKWYGYGTALEQRYHSVHNIGSYQRTRRKGPTQIEITLLSNSTQYVTFGSSQLWKDTILNVWKKGWKGKSFIESEITSSMSRQFSSLCFLLKWISLLYLWKREKKRKVEMEKYARDFSSPKKKSLIAT